MGLVSCCAHCYSASSINLHCGVASWACVRGLLLPKLIYSLKVSCESVSLPHHSRAIAALVAGARSCAVCAPQPPYFYTVLFSARTANCFCCARKRFAARVTAFAALASAGYNERPMRTFDCSSARHASEGSRVKRTNSDHERSTSTQQNGGDGSRTATSIPAPKREGDLIMASKLMLL